MNKSGFQETGYLWYRGEVHKALYYEGNYHKRIYKTDKDGHGIEIWNSQDTDSKHQHPIERNTAITCGRDEDGLPLTTVRIDLDNHKVSYNQFANTNYDREGLPYMAYGCHWYHKGDSDEDLSREMYFIDQPYSCGLWITNDFQFYKEFRIIYDGYIDYFPSLIGLSKDSIVCDASFNDIRYIAICHYRDIVSETFSGKSKFVCVDPIVINVNQLMEDYQITSLNYTNDSTGNWSTAYDNTLDYEAESRICIPCSYYRDDCKILGIDTTNGNILYCRSVASNEYSPHSLLTRSNHVTFIEEDSSRYGRGRELTINTETGELISSRSFGSIPEYDYPFIHADDCIELGGRRYYYIEPSSSTTKGYDYIVTDLNGLARYPRIEPVKNTKSTILIPVYNLDGEFIANHYVTVATIISAFSNRSGSSTPSRYTSWPGLFYVGSNARYERIPDQAVSCSEISFCEQNGTTILPITCKGYVVTTNIMAMDATNTFICAIVYE